MFEAIVDGLAEQGYAVADHFLSREELDLLRNELHRQFAQGEFKAAGIGQGQEYQRRNDIRGDYIRWIDRENLAADCHFLLDRLEALAQFLNETCYLGIRNAEFHFALYPAGSFYKRHLDVFHKTKARKISVICYLNADWQAEQGGQLRLYVPDNEGNEVAIDVLPQGGRMVCFKSDMLEHEVLPATRERLSVTGWLRSDDGILG
ncbi:MAG: 2OG-Fe(II) oxygenase [Saprospiraceae bacterium]